jgi:diaminopimelate epimerase
MDYRNADGSIAQMCGNGVRCAAKFVHDYGYIHGGETTIDIDTRAGVKTINLFIENGKLTKARVDMGKPSFAANSLPTTLAENESGKILDREIQTPYGSVVLSCVSMGNPHAVIFLEGEAARNIGDMDIDQLGAHLESSEYFPENCNIEFAAIIGGPENKIIMRVFERGVGETLACGTGACATAVLACETERSKGPQLLSLLGGELLIEYAQGENVFMTGPAKEVFKGVIYAAI